MCIDVLAIVQLLAQLLQVGIPHVLDAEDEDVLVVRNGVADVLEQLVLVFARLLGDLRHVDGSVSFGLGHGGRLVCVCFRRERVYLFVVVEGEEVPKVALCVVWEVRTGNDGLVSVPGSALSQRRKSSLSLSKATERYPELFFFATKKRRAHRLGGPAEKGPTGVSIQSS